jgi:ribonuclease-3
LLQAKHLPVPQYRLLATRGDAHAQEFEVSCVVPEIKLEMTGKGVSRRGAEQQAAQAALDKLRER